MRLPKQAPAVIRGVTGMPLRPGVVPAQADEESCWKLLSSIVLACDAQDLLTCSGPLKKFLNCLLVKLSAQAKIDEGIQVYKDAGCEKHFALPVGPGCQPTFLTPGMSWVQRDLALIFRTPD